MSRGSITLIDDEDGPGFKMEVDFGDKFNDESMSHQVISASVESILKWSSSFQKLEDTAPEVNLEPSVIIKTN